MTDTPAPRPEPPVRLEDPARPEHLPSAEHSPRPERMPRAERPRRLTRTHRSERRGGPAAGAPAIGAVLAVIAVATVSLNLRPGATSLGPLLEDVVAFHGQGGLAMGLLTALPCLAFGVLGALAVPISKRVGLTGTVVASFVLVVAGLLLRPQASTFVMFTLLSLLALVGPALGNVIVPAWIKQYGGRRTVALMTLYSTLLGVGGASGSAFAVPLITDEALGWQDSLRFWGLLAVVPVVVWTIVLARTGHDFPPDAAQGELRTSVLRSPTAVALTAMFGLQSMNAYTQIGLLPQILTQGGMSAADAGLVTGSVAAWGILGGLVMPTVIERSRHLPLIALGMGLLTAAGYIGLILAPAAGALLWAAVLGVGGFAFPTAIALIPARSRDPLVTARLSGMVQPVGYLIAAAGSITAGVVLDATGSAHTMLTMMAVTGLALGVVGFRAARPAFVDDEMGCTARS
ncbi:MFS transporter [Brachybacterium sp. p3-SID1565]|uniref:MFS transporter n=1 Tax=Brachybacterium sp. p3-SID1565 TaxID=2916046 RepID=UPI0021A68F57|nr:MFS transporter [Brachybacterium sp. p3-SID1565]MCT1385451.1 MFS transporter [Brachybacterium sp. p3-SID1565]